MKEIRALTGIRGIAATSPHDVISISNDFDRYPEHVAKVSRGLGEAMRGLQMSDTTERLADRGW